MNTTSWSRGMIEVDVLQIVLARATDRDDALVLGGARDGAGAVEHVLELVGLGPCLARLFGPLISVPALRSPTRASRPEKDGVRASCLSEPIT